MSDYTLPKYFEIEKELFEIRNKGDYRIVLSCFNIMSDINLSEYERELACLMVFYTNFNTVDDLLNCKYLVDLSEKMHWFFDCDNRYTNPKKQEIKLLDWDDDSLLICSAVNKVAGKDIRDEDYLHWWTFMSYYMEIGECLLSQIVSIRYKIVKNEKLEKYETKFRNENPQYFNIDLRTVEEKETDDWISQHWDGVLE